MPREYVVGVDIGTGSLKGVLVTSNGDIVHTATRSHTAHRPQPGWVEMDASGGWWELVAEILRELVQIADGIPIRGVCVSGLGPSLVVTDDQLVPLRPAILYGIDTRSSAQVESANRALGIDQILERCGKHLTSQALGPKLMWIQENEPDTWRATRKWFSSHTYIVARLTGEWVLDHHTASQCDPLYDVDGQRWASDWAAELLPDMLLPPLVWPSDVVGHVTSAAASTTGLAVGTPVMAGTVDAWAEAFSVGVRSPGDMMIMYGSTMFIVQVLPAPAAYPGLWTTAGVEPDSFTLAAGMATSGSVANWLQDIAGGAEFGELLMEAGEVRAGSDGLVVLPYFSGERSPIFDADARGVVAGLTLSHSRGHLMRAIHEGVAYGVRHNLEDLNYMVGPPTRVVAVGGGVRGGLWPQIVSDVCNIEQSIPVVTTGASYGDALLAAIGAGLVNPNTDWTVDSDIVTPNPANAAVYHEAYSIYRDLYPSMRTAMHRLARLQDSVED
jgi:xylulokinase